MLLKVCLVVWKTSLCFLRTRTCERDGDDDVGEGEGDEGLDAAVHRQMDGPDFRRQPEEQQDRDHADRRPDAQQADPDLDPRDVPVVMGSSLKEMLS